MVSVVGVVTAVTSAITGDVVSVVVVVLSVVVESSEDSSFSPQEMKMKLKRNMEKMMSICLTWFPLGGLGKHKLYQNMWCFTRIGDLTWKVSYFKESLGSVKGDDGVGSVDAGLRTLYITTILLNL